MKSIYKLFFICSFFSIIDLEAQVLDLQSTTQGLLLPRMNTMQKENITNTSQSLLVYDTDTKSFWYYEDMMWNELAAGNSMSGFSGDSGVASPAAPIIDGDLAGVSSTINLTAPGTITAETQIEICVNISHSYLLDVDISLKATDGSTVLDLSSDNGGSDDNYTNTCFTTNAALAITAGTAPFTGNFIPEQTLADLIGQSIAGDWVLTVVDDDSVEDFGTFNSWSIAFQNGDPLLANLLSDDDDTRIQVEKTIDEDTIRVEIKGTETVTLSENEAKFNTNVTASAFIGDGSQLTGLSAGGCTKYGDGSAGDLTISSSTD